MYELGLWMRRRTKHRRIRIIAASENESVAEFEIVVDSVGTNRQN